ncbi:MAG: rhodanese-like domain-containing protein [Salinisphaera sp.]|jgi:rhodanese-related sulfurtransferase|nr:rhodanese-like domain-containing protein [Salinisphaera sp.]
MALFDRLRRRLPGGKNKTTTTTSYLSEEPTMIDHHQARQAQQDGATLVDVRELDEWQAGHAAGAVLHPVTAIASDSDIGLSTDTPIVTYCKAGARAERAAELLSASGYHNVRAMAAGFEDWRAAGYPTE